MVFMHVRARLRARLELTPTEYQLLYHLVRNAGRVLQHATLLAKVWGREYVDEVDYLRVYVRRLRDKPRRRPGPSQLHPHRTGAGLPVHRARSLLVGVPDPRRVGGSTMGACYKRSMDGAIRPLRDVRAGDATEVGGKAARLGELLASGVRVPDGFVLGVADGASDAGGDDPVAALRAAARALDPGPFAVRSSAVGEDGDERSFAGMYESVLGVAPDDVPDAVERVRASADGRVLAYDRAAGARMAVIVQRMVVARAAGVALTASPRMTGERRWCVVTAVRGLGERLVSGRTAGDEWVVRGRHATARRTPERAITDREVRRIAIAAR